MKINNQDISNGGQKRPRWNQKQISLLRKNYRSMSNAELSKIIGRPVSSIVFKAHKLRKTNTRIKKGAKRLTEMGRENISRRWNG
jgi:hypothetical protein